MAEPVTSRSAADLVAKLRAHAESARRIGSVHEAEAFADKVRDLMARHNITEPRPDEKPPQVRVPFYPGEHGRRLRRSAVADWEWELAVAAARLCLAAAASSQTCNVVYFYGVRENCEAAILVYAYLLIAAERLSREYVKSERCHNRRRLHTPQSRSRFRQSFRLGFSRAICERASKKIEAPAEALVRLDQVIAAATAERDRFGTVADDPEPSKRLSLHGLVLGWEAGCRFDLHRRKRLSGGSSG